MLATVAAAAFLVSLVTLRLVFARLGRVALDQPNARSLHERPVPRTGGLAVLAGAATSLPLGAQALWLPAGIAAALALLSFVDDLRGLPTLLRFSGHLAAAIGFAAAALSELSPVAVAALVIAIAWLTNLYNFMDGADGLAGGMAVIGFGAYALAAQTAGASALASASVAIAAAAAAFLLHNFHPARIFLGDAGSIPLGFLAAALGLLGWRDGLWPLWFPLLVFAPFVADATATLVRRLARGERVWVAHREHYYQRMVRMGVGHRATALAYYALMLACACAALYARGASIAGQALASAAAALLLIGTALWIDRRWARQ